MPLSSELLYFTWYKTALFLALEDKCIFKKSEEMNTLGLMYIEQTVISV